MTSIGYDNPKFHSNSKLNVNKPRLPGDGSGLDSPPAGLLFREYAEFLGRIPESGLAKGDTKRGFAGVTSPSMVSDSNKEI